MDTNQRDFELEIIFSIINKRYLTTPTKIYDILNYLTGSKVSQYQIGEVLDEAGKHILTSYPALKTIQTVKKLKNPNIAMEYIRELKQVFGDTLSLKPMPKTMSVNQTLGTRGLTRKRT